MTVYDMYKSIEETDKWASGTEAMFHVFDEVLNMMKEYHPDKYDMVQNKLYIALNGYHFNEDMLKEYTHHIINDNGSTAPKWSVEDTNSVARNLGLTFKDFNEYDWNYVMNMLYSDYCEVLGETVSSYSKMALKFLDDKDGPSGKALRYAMCMKKDY